MSDQAAKPGPAIRGIRLVEGPERGKLELGGSTFHYTRIPHGDMVDLRVSCSPRGILDMKLLHEALWKRVLVGWEDLFIGPEDAAVALPFSEGEVLRVANALPDALGEAILNEARAAQFLLADALGN